ncbi:cupredoxin domain-containing protein, partial [Candidatus Microgenomates bacterium]|nr:cupredoxin domain-containing protein [Candidatus Microgenomates bacterium]
MQKSVIIGVGVVLLVVVAGALFFLNPRKTTVPQEQSQIQQSTQKTDTSFQNPKKSAHYESNTPAHGVVLPGVPINVVIDFNFDLAKPSGIKIEKDGKDYGVGETVIDENKLTMRREMDPASSDGVYTVNYNACWPDKSCHDGYFQFAIDRSKSQNYDDMIGKKEIEIRLSQIKFAPENLKISKGTKVIWVNDDSVEHYVNTDSHPAHTYYLQQNSKVLKKGESFSLTFDDVGIYPYHCSAHASSMV